MEDIQNTKGDYGFKINKVGVENILHPMILENNQGSIINTIGNFSMAVSLEKGLRGINMSRLPIVLADLHNSGWKISDIRADIKYFLDNIRASMECEDGFLDIEFQYFVNKKAPVSNYAGIMPYKCKIQASLCKDKEGSIARSSYDNEDIFDLILTVEIPITTLCPCSKAISEFSAHNQRGYVEVSIKYGDTIYIEEIINTIESLASCEVYPILKRTDEKYVTEKAYENPRFVEDIVRLSAEKLFDDPRIHWLKISSIHQESIHPHNAFAVIELYK
ncbi:MAG: GTP cyclohydrolase FolE2 [Bacillota bacterium]|nr:GTP cyclohydrolase FolE2 [Bacillota bacterium]